MRTNRVSQLPGLTRDIEYLEEVKSLQKRIPNLPNGKIKDELTRQLKDSADSRPDGNQSHSGKQNDNVISIFVNHLRSRMEMDGVRGNTLELFDKYAEIARSSFGF
jgi:hypothetical protein